MCAIFQLAIKEVPEIHDICDDITRKYGAESAAGCLDRDIYPGGTAIVSGGARKAALMTWGFPMKGSPKRVFNARSESLAERPMFRPVLRNRCLVPASGFYEFDREHRRYHIALPGRPFFYLAGLWEPVRNPDGSVYFCFPVIPTAPNRQIGAFHDRMPAILPPETAAVWLGAGEELRTVLRPLEEEMSMVPV